MIDGKMPKDIRVYKTKIIGPLTGRQILLVLLLLIIDLILYRYVVGPLSLPREAVIYGLILIDIPIAAFGWIEPQGMPLERYLKDVLIRYLMVPTCRKAKLVLYEADPLDEGKLKKNRRKKRKSYQ